MSESRRENQAQSERKPYEAFSAHARVQTVLHSILKVETHEDGTESFVELLKPSPTVEEVIAAAAGLENLSGESEGRTLKVVIAKLDKVLWGMGKKPIEDGTLEARLKKFEEEVEMPAEGRGGLFRLLSDPGCKVDAVVMFLSTYFDAAAPPEGNIAGGN